MTSTSSKILVYDIEAGALTPDRGRLFVFAYQWLNDPQTRACRTCGGRHPLVHTPSLLDYNPACEHGLMKQDERELIREAHKVMGQAEVAITFNGRRYDEAFMVTKFMRERLPPLGYTRMIDLYQTARHKMRLRTKSLENIAKYLKLKHQKTKLDWDVWDLAREGDAKSHRYIRDHGGADIRVTEELYLEHLRPYVPNHPYLFEDRDPCRRCGARVVRDKVIRTLSRDKVQYKCTKCGSYETRSA